MPRPNRSNGNAAHAAISEPHAWAIQNELGRLLGNHLSGRGGPCGVVTTPGVIPRVRSDANLRIPDLAVTCAEYREEEAALAEPVLIVEILSPSNQAETWSNVWAYTTIPSVREILVVRSATIGADLLRRSADGSWPERAETLTEGVLRLDSLGFAAPLAALYRTTRLAPRSGTAG